MNDDDIQLQSYQDDLATNDNATDPLMDELGEDPTEELGIPREAFKEELDKSATDETGGDDSEHDDRREYMEDLDEDHGKR